MKRKTCREILMEHGIIATSHDGGINWDWVHLSNKTDAERVDKLLIRNGYETRGVYGPQTGHADWGVRYR